MNASYSRILLFALLIVTGAHAFHKSKNAPLPTFENLGNMAGMTVSIPRGQWGFAITSPSQFFDAAPTLGLRDATFMTAEDLRIETFSYEGSEVMISFRTVAGQLYRLESTEDLTAEEWASVQGDLVGTGGLLTVREPAASAQRIYRLRRLR